MARVVCFVVVCAVLAIVADAAKDKKDVWMEKKLAEKLRLHKEESNFIDHGPSAETETKAKTNKYRKHSKKGYQHHRRANGLLGHRGEHWATGGHHHHNNKGRQQNDLDDARLQDVAFQPTLPEEVVKQEEDQEEEIAKPQKKRFRKKGKNTGKKNKVSQSMELKRTMKKAALKGMDADKALAGFDGNSKEGKLARKYYNKWAAKYGKSKKSKGKRRKYSAVP